MAELLQEGVPQAPPEEAAAAADIAGLTVEMSVQQLQAQQVHQAELISNMQSTINAMSAKQTELEEEIKGLKGGKWVVKAEPKRVRRGGSSTTGAAAPSSSGTAQQTVLAVGNASGGMIGTTDDDEVDAIIEMRKEKNTWPLARKYCSSFTNEIDLLKIRMHKSDRHRHVSTRIPRIDSKPEDGSRVLGNKEGRLICRLCSGKTINRNTSYLCSTCCVPLCQDYEDNKPETSCHARWHACQDLVSVHATLNAALREKRESRKRSREDMNVTSGAPVVHQDEMAQVAQICLTAAAGGQEVVQMERVQQAVDKTIPDLDLTAAEVTTEDLTAAEVTTAMI